MSPRPPMGDPRNEEEWRQLQRENGCTCECERIYDPERVREVGGDPDDPGTICFHHTPECPMTRAHFAQWN